jgi:hypothetical protein
MQIQTAFDCLSDAGLIGACLTSVVSPRQGQFVASFAALDDKL